MKWTENLVRWPSTIYFLLTFLVSWSLWIPAIRPLQGIRTFDVPVWAIVLLLVGGAGPSIAAVIMTHAIGGTRAVRELLADFLRWNVGLRWYAVVILLWVFLYLAAVLVCATISGQPPALQPKQALSLVSTYALWFLIALPTGPCLEELGWRGFSLPQLQQRYSALTSAVIVGVAWCFWHLPLLFVPGLSFPGGETILTAPDQIVWTLLGTIGASILFAWVYNSTRGSLLLAVLFHASLNATPNALRPIFYPEASGELITIISRSHLVLMWLVAIGLVAVFGPRHLSRGADLARREWANCALQLGVLPRPNRTGLIEPAGERSDSYKQPPRPRLSRPGGYVSGGDRIRTCDLEVMSLASYRTAPPRDIGFRAAGPAHLLRRRADAWVVAGIFILSVTWRGVESRLSASAAPVFPTWGGGRLATVTTRATARRRARLRDTSSSADRCFACRLDTPLLDFIVDGLLASGHHRGRPNPSHHARALRARSTHG